MPTPPYDIASAQSMLLASKGFLSRFTRNNYPYLATANLLLKNNFHTVEGRRGYLPAEASVSEGQTLAILGCIRAYKATGDTEWLGKAVGFSESYLTYFFPTPTPPATSNPTTTVWIAHWAVNASNYAIPGKGSQDTARAFNFGNFNYPLSFVNGSGIIPGGLLADLYKVTSSDGELLYQNVYAPLKSGIEYSIGYSVSNYRLEGINYRNYPDGSKTPTSETPGTIVLSGVYSNFTGTAKVYFSSWIASNIPPYGMLEPYPMWHNPNRGGNTYLGCANDSLYWGYDGFIELYPYTGNIKWVRAAYATRDTLANCAVVENPSYFYFREKGNPFILAGAQAIPINRDFNGYTASRINSPGVFQYYLRLDIAAATPPPSNYPSFEIQNYIVATYIQSTISVYLEAASNKRQILEIVLSLSPNTLDTTQEYTAYWLVQGDAVPRNVTCGYTSFVKWGSGTVWHSLNADTPLYTYGGGEFSIVTEQAVIDGRLAIAQVVTVNPDDVIGTGFSVTNFTNSPPSIKVATSGKWTMVLRDSDDDFWKCSVPNTNNNWTEFSPSWSDFASVNGKDNPSSGTILGCAFESEDRGVIKLYYAGAAPQNPAQGSTSYKALVRSRIADAQILWIGNFYPIGNSNDKLKYNPGVIPFTINVLADGNGGFIKDSWGGAPYAGYQSPYHWQIWGYPERALQALQFLNDSQLAYQKQSNVGLLAPLIQVFLWKYWDTADFRAFGSEGNEWTWKGADPNTAWFPYCARPMEATARYLMLVPNSVLARKILTRYLSWIQDFLAASGNQPPTDVPPIISPQANYHEPHVLALLLRTALYANVAGLSPDITFDIMSRCFTSLQAEYVATGVMAGSFTAFQPTFTFSGTTYREYFGFWHLEIISTLAELILYKDRLNYPLPSAFAKAGIFPSLVPDFIEDITLPPYKFDKVSFDDGSLQKIRRSDTGVKMEMTLKYTNLSPVDAQVLIDFWRLSQGSQIPFLIPSNVLRLPSSILNAIASQGSTTYWRFTENPEVTPSYLLGQRGLLGVTLKVVSVMN